MPPEPEQWLLWEWPQRAELPSHYWLSTLPADTPLERLVYLVRLRGRVEREFLVLGKARWQRSHAKPKAPRPRSASKKRRVQKSLSGRKRTDAKAPQTETEHWTLAQVCRRLQALFVRWIGVCLLVVKPRLPIYSNTRGFQDVIKSC